MHNYAVCVLKMLLYEILVASDVSLFINALQLQELIIPAEFCTVMYEKQILLAKRPKNY